jgi:type I restriction enzyme, S subunit
VSNGQGVRLGELFAPRLGSIDPRRYPDESFVLYSIPAFESGASERLRGRDIGSAKQVVQPGDVLLSRIVPHIRRAWVVGSDPTLRTVASNEWLVFRNERVDPDYLRHVLVGDRFHSAFMATVSGVGGSLLRAKSSYVAEIEIPLPPLAEQRRIAALLDRADAVRRKHEESRRLVDELLRSVFLEMFGDPVRNEKGWEVRPLSGRSSPLAEVKAGPFGSALKKETYTSAGYRVYGQEQVLAGSLETGAYFVDEATYLRLRSCSVRAGDLLVSLVGSFGKVLIVPEGHHPGIINPRLVRIRPSLDAFDPRFLASALQQSSVQERLKSMSHGGTMGILNAGQLKLLPVIVPPIDLQRTFAAQARRIEQLRDKVGAAGAESEHLGLRAQSHVFAV